MAPQPGRDLIRVRGARQNNLKGINVDIPTRSLTVITGLSGSGKSSLAFDTLYAEGQRRYIETFSPYARQFFDRMDKPRVDAIEGIPPAIALEQRNAVRTTRSTVGTMTEVNDYLKILWPHIALLHCRQCGNPVLKESPRDVWDALQTLAARAPSPPDALVTFELPLSPKLPLEEQLALIRRQGFQRLLIHGSVSRVEEAASLLHAAGAQSVQVIQDRIRLAPAQRARFAEAAEQAYHFGHGKLTVVIPANPDDPAPTGVHRRFSRHLHCATCDIEYQTPSTALFSFNHPVGACPTCKGFGRTISIDYRRAIPDRSLSLKAGAVKPWQTGSGLESQGDLTRFARRRGVPMDVPFRELAPEHQRWVIEGDPDYGEGNEWPNAWYGVRGYFRWLESKAYKMHVRVLLSRYRSYQTCPACHGGRFQPDTLLWKVPASRLRHAGRTPGDLTLADFNALPAADALTIVHALAEQHPGGPGDPITLAFDEIRARLQYLVDVGVGYLALGRATRTLSGGETQRVNLTTCLGSRLVNTLFVLDEPSVGLHPRDTSRLVTILHHLRDLGNTVVVVEHEPAIMRAADEIIDLGPGHGDAGGEVVVQGPWARVLAHPTSQTGGYLSRRLQIPIPPRRPVHLPGASGEGDRQALQDQAVPYRALFPGSAPPLLRLRHISRNNLRDLSVDIPLGRLVGLSGVSGSGKSTLAGELLNLLRDRLGNAVTEGSLGARETEAEEDDDDASGGADRTDESGPSDAAALEGEHHLGRVMLVDQSPIGRTPRSNPAVYTGAFQELRQIFAATDAARQAGLNASAFSFNSAQGQCEQCRGAGFEKIEMQFLSDVYIRCPACNGRRYRPHILEVRIPGLEAGHTLSIADVLELTVEDCLALLRGMQGTPARRAASALQWIQDVGLGYLRVGQPVNTLSGGESQRLKLAGHLALAPEASLPADSGTAATPTLFVLDEPTTGLHFEDVRVLLQVLHRLVDAGHTVLVIEHNIEVLKSADWIIDLGPEGGDAGGQVVVSGTPEHVAACKESHTGAALREALSPM